MDEGAIPSESERVYLQRAASVLGAKASFADLSQRDGNGASTNKHDPEKLSVALGELVKG